MSETEKRSKGRGRRLYKQNPKINSPGLTHLNVVPPASEIGHTKNRTPSPPGPNGTHTNTSVPLESENPQDTSQTLDRIEDVPPLDPTHPNAYLHVRITEVIDPGNFYAMVALKEHLDHFDAMTRELIELCDTHDTALNTCPRRDDVIGVNTGLLENFGLEYKWVRGRVIRIHSEEMIEVLLLDFGSTFLVKLSEICTTLSEALKRTHSLCRHCYITDCQPIQQNWSRQACDFFHTLIYKCSPLIRAAAFTGALLKNTFIGLNLYGFDGEPMKWKSFGRELIHAGHAVTYNNPSLTLYQPSVQTPTSVANFQDTCANPNTRSTEEFYAATGYLPMTSQLLEYATTSLEGENPAGYSHSAMNIMQHLDDNSTEFQQQYMDALLNYGKVRSLDSVTSYDEFVPRVHPLDVNSADTGADGVGGVEGTELDPNPEVENVTAKQAELKISDNSILFSSTHPLDSNPCNHNQSVETQTQFVAPTQPPGSKSPRSMGRGQMIRQNMERARLTDSGKSSPASSSTREQLSLQIAQITVTPESFNEAYPLAAENADSVENQDRNDDVQNSPQSQPLQPESSKSSDAPDNAVDQDITQDLDASLGQNDNTADTASSQVGPDGNTRVDYNEEFEESFGYTNSNGTSASRHSRGRSRRSPVHWKRGSPANRRHKYSPSKDNRAAQIPLASKYAKSITSQAHAKIAPSIQETEIAHMKLMLAMKLDQLLANFREETQKQFPDHLMKLMNDQLANKIATILGPTGPFSILLDCIFQRSIEHPTFLPLSFMVLSRLYSMYRQSMTEVFSHVFISTQNALLAKIVSEETDATQYTHNYCQMISAYIEFILSKDLHPALMHLVESTILKFLLEFAGKGLELPIENVDNYQIKSECLYTILEKSGRVLLNLKTEYFSEIKQTIDSNISQLKTMPLTLYNSYTRCLQLFDDILAAGKEAPSGLTNLPPLVAPPPPQAQEHPLYPNQGYKQAAPVFQQDPRACLQQNIPTQPQYVMQGYYQQPPVQMPNPISQNYAQPQYDANVYHPQPLQPVMQQPTQQHMMAVNTQHHIQVQPQQYQQQHPVLQSQSSAEAIHSPNPPMQTVMSYSNLDPFDQIRKMLTDLNEPDQIKKFEDARIQDDLLTADWYDLECVLKDSQIPRGLILRIKRYLNQNTQFTATQQNPQQFKHQPAYTVQDMKIPSHSMVPPLYQQSEHLTYQQQVLDPSYVYPVPQMVQSQPQILNPNANTNNNNSNTQFQYDQMLQPRFIIPTQHSTQTQPQPSTSKF